MDDECLQMAARPNSYIDIFRNVLLVIINKGMGCIIPTFSKIKQRFNILVVGVLLYILYNVVHVTDDALPVHVERPARDFAHVDSVYSPKAQMEHFNVKNYTFPLSFDIKDVVRQHIQDGRPLPTDIANPRPYKYIYSPSKCDFSISSKPHVLVLVKSAVGNVARRAVLRQVAETGVDANTRMLFMLGFQPRFQFLIIQENNKYNDLIQEDFLDTYQNNTLKTIMAFNWALKYCPGANLFLFLDDDILVDWANMTSYFENVYTKNKTDVFYGQKVPPSDLYRSPFSTWYVSPDVYPFKKWPTYLAGGAFLVSYDVAYKFKMAFPYVRYVPIDDAYLGMVASVMSIRPCHSTELSRRGKFSIVKECRHIPAEVFASKCQLQGKYVPYGNLNMEDIAEHLKGFIEVFSRLISILPRTVRYISHLFK